MQHWQDGSKISEWTSGLSVLGLKQNSRDLTHPKATKFYIICGEAGEQRPESMSQNESSCFAKNIVMSGGIGHAFSKSDAGL